MLSGASVSLIIQYSDEQESAKVGMFKMDPTTVFKGQIA